MTLLTLLGGAGTDTYGSIQRKLFPVWKFGDGDVASMLNDSLKANLDFLHARPAFRVTSSAPQDIDALVPTYIEFDTDAYMEGATQRLPHVFEVNRPGVWRFSWCMMCTVDAPGSYYVDIMEIWGSKIHARERVWCPNGFAANSGTTECNLETNALVGIRLSHDMAGGLTVTSDGDYTPIFSGYWVSGD